MRAFVLEVPEELLAERRRTGADRRDEVWNGVLHMVPAPSFWHQRFGGELYVVLKSLLQDRGLLVVYEVSIHRPGTKSDYRTPDLVVCRPEHASERGVEGVAALAVEILSPDDETYEKVPFYESVGVEELLVLDPKSRKAELFVRRGERLLPALPDDAGTLRSPTLGVSFTLVPGPLLEVRWTGGSARI